MIIQIGSLLSDTFHSKFNWLASPRHIRILHGVRKQLK